MLTASAALAVAAPASGATVVATVPVGRAPVGLALTPDGGKAYVADFLGNSVSVVSTATNAVVKTIALQGVANPFGVAVDPSGRRAYVTENSDRSITVIDTASDTAVGAVVLVGDGPRQVAFAQGGAVGLVTNNVSGTLSRFDTATNAVVWTLPVGNRPAAVAVSPDGALAWITLQGDGALVGVDPVTGQLQRTITGLGQATGLALTADGSKAYVSDFSGGLVRVVDTASGTVTKTLTVGSSAYEIALHGPRAYVVDSGGDALTVLDTVRDEVVETLPVGDEPTDVAVSPDGATVYVSNTAGNSVTVLRPTPADTTAPTVVVPADQVVEATSPSGAVVAYPAATASDDVDGPLTPTCTPSSGSAFPLGRTTVTCSATDAAGNTGTARFPVTVTYGWSGVLQPVNADGSSIFKLGSTVPVKFALTGASAGISTAVATLSHAKVTQEVQGSSVEAVSTSSATTGSLFRYDATSRQYVFNWSTRGLTSGSYVLTIDLGDGASRTVPVSLR